MERGKTISSVFILLDEMKKPSRSKSISTVVVPSNSSTEFDLFSCYSHEKVHIFDKLWSSLSSQCELAYCTSEGITICVPQRFSRHSSNLSSSSSCSSLSSMFVSRVVYPFQPSDQSNSISSNSSSSQFGEKLRDTYFPNLYKAYKLRPTSLSSFDRLLCLDTIQSNGFRSCLFSPMNVNLTRGQSLLAAISCAHELFIYQIVSSSNRFYLSQSSNLQFYLTKRLMENSSLKEILHDSPTEENQRFLYFHLTSQILWNDDGKILFQLQFSGHLIRWTFDGSNEPMSTIIDTNISKPSSMSWNEDQRLLIVIGLENQRVLVRFDQTIKVISIPIDQNDFLNTDYSTTIR